MCIRNAITVVCFFLSHSSNATTLFLFRFQSKPFSVLCSLNMLYTNIWSVLRYNNIFDSIHVAVYLVSSFDWWMLHFHIVTRAHMVVFHLQLRLAISQFEFRLHHWMCLLLQLYSHGYLSTRCFYSHSCCVLWIVQVFFFSSFRFQIQHIFYTKLLWFYDSQGASVWSYNLSQFCFSHESFNCEQLVHLYGISYYALNHSNS